jgi:predicted HicB family RNase H-like nuclease
MNVMSHRGYFAKVEFDAEDEIFVGHVAGIRDVVGFHADDVATLKAAFREAVDDYLLTCERVGKSPDKPYSGRVMFRVAPDVHAQAALAAEVSGKSLNQFAEEALRSAAEARLAARS